MNVHEESNKKKYMSGDLSDDLIKITDEFNNTVFRILKICKHFEPNNIDIEWLHKRLTYARTNDSLLIMDRSKDKIWFYRNEILSRNLNFFMKNTFDGFIKDDDNKPFMYTLLNTIKKRIPDLSEKEKVDMWDLVNQLLVYVTMYKIRCGEHQ